MTWRQVHLVQQQFLQQQDCTCRASGTIDTGTANSDPIQGFIYPRPDSFFVHRPYDGGVQLGTGGPQHGSQAIRQSKNTLDINRGKWYLHTTGVRFQKKKSDLLNVTASGTSIGPNYYVYN